MPFQELPVELLQEILHHAFKVRGMKRFMRLRLVSKTLAREVENVIFVFRLLDGRLCEARFGLPPFVKRYLEHRVLNQAEADGYPNLITIRKVAEKISQGADVDGKGLDLHEVVERLCGLVLRLESTTGRLSRIFDKDPESNQQAFSDHLIVAAVECNCFDTLKSLSAESDWLWTNSWLFGSPYRIAAFNGDHDMLRYLMSETINSDTRLPRLREQAFTAAAIAGRVETVKFLFHLRREEVPWRFEDRTKGTSGTYDQPLSSAMTTPSKEVLDFVTFLQKNYSTKKTIWRTDEESLTHRLRRCAEEGWTEMAAHLLVQGACPDGIRADPESTFRPMIRACMRGHTDVVRLLLYYSADTNKALHTAAFYGHRDIVMLLLDAGAATVGAIAEAASGGWLDIIRLLLDHGAGIDGPRNRPHPLQSAFEQEHTAMFELLMQRGATLTEQTFQACLRYAVADGLDSLASICRYYGDGDIPKNIQNYLDTHA
ncbi:ankyrin repeat-containing domain protein [Lophiotrema nucula]|uniref:Ankyrin repeat-containing domain protein n=1 Tax=Lophiotrema nucula TaxID=690887 RepID=A0A6A5ZK68_9PLEO|nr:ankyrin repeat-containing domain protein [Lophiotrema nucula]